MAASHAQTATESLEEMLESVEGEILNVNVGGPTFSITVKGSDVQPDVFNAAYRFGATNVEKVRGGTWTDEVGECTTVSFYW